jgi:acetyl esterase/lipase
MSTPQPMFNLPPAARQTMAEIGPIWGSNILKHRGLVVDAYTALHQKVSKAGITLKHDLPYGKHPRQVMDVFTPDGAKNAPVVIFVHGGAFVRGNKSDNDEIYGNVLYYFARHGYVGINLEYRNAPEAQYPEAAVDIREALAWLRANIAQYGGDARRMFIIGHSAGGTHVGTYVFDPVMERREDDGVKGAVLISARLRADDSPANPNAAAVKAYFGDDVTKLEERSPVTHAANSELPVMLAIAEFENPLLDIYGAQMFAALRAVRPRASRFVQLMAHNHTSIMAHINTEEDFLGSEVRIFFESCP